MNITYIKTLDLTKAEDRLAMMNELNHRPHGQTSFISDIVDIAFDDQSANGTFKAYLLIVAQIISIQMINPSTVGNLNNQKQMMNSLLNAVFRLADAQEAKTFSFYGEMPSIVWTFLADSNLPENKKIQIYGVSLMIEDLFPSSVKFTSFETLLEKESAKTKLKVYMVMDTLKDIVK